MIRCWSLAILSLMVIGIVSSQERSLTIIGTGEALKPANQAEIAFTVQKDGQTLRSALSEAQSYLTRIHNDLLAIGLDSTSLQQSRVRVDEKNMTWFTSHKYRAVLRTKIVVQNLQLLDTLLDVLSKYDIEQMSEIQFTLTDERILSCEAYVEALENAKLNANRIAKAESLSLGDIISVSEESVRNEAGSDYLAGESSGFPFFRSSREYVTFFPEQIRLRKALKVIFSLH